MVEVVVVGDCAVDVYAYVDEMPAFGQKLMGRPAGIFGGGVAANVACSLSRLGTSASLVGAVGDDLFGKLAVDDLLAFNVDTCSVISRPETSTSWNFVAVGPDGEKALTILPSENFFPKCREFSVDRLERVDHVHIAPFDINEAMAFAVMARDVGVTVSMDIEPAMLRRASLGQFPDLFEMCSILFLNQFSFAELFGSRSLVSGLRDLRGHGPEVALVTLGENGSVLQTAGGTWRVGTGETGSVVDTTGAGDCHNAIFLHEWLNGVEAAEAAINAAAGAAMSLQSLGSRTSYPTVDAIAKSFKPALERMSE